MCLTSVHLFCYCKCMDSGFDSYSVVALMEPVNLVAQGSGCALPAEAVLAEWASCRFDPGLVAGWSPEQARLGLVELEQVRRSIDAVTAVLTARLAAGRDLQAALCRSTGMSSRDARAAVDVGKVVDRLPEAGNLLASGAVSAGHLRPLAHITPELAAELLPHAVSMGVDDFITLVKQRNVKQHSKTLAEEQEASRSIEFFETKNGCVGARIVLPPVDGVEFRETLNQLCDTQYRKDHPERADTLGGHDIEPRSRRLADAFRIWMRNKTLSIGKPAVIVTIEAETLDAHIVPNQPIPLRTAMELVARSELYAAIKTKTNRAQLVFGRNRRLATPLQRLALMALQETCVWEGCTRPAQHCDVDHQHPYELGGTSDIGNYRFYCGLHHPHHHETGVDVYEQPDGTWKIRPPDPPKT
jgi:hypothetical protein